jgi:hypothetical protein
MREARADANGFGSLSRLAVQLHKTLDLRVVVAFERLEAVDPGLEMSSKDPAVTACAHEPLAGSPKVRSAGLDAVRSPADFVAHVTVPR